MNQKCAKNRGFFYLLKSLVIHFYRICSIIKIIAVLLHKSHIWENFSSRDIGQNVLSQWDRRIFQPIISPELISKIAFIFLNTDKNSLKLEQNIFGWTWSKMVLASLVIGKTDYILGMNRWNELVLVCSCKFRKANCWSNYFWVGMVRNGHGHLVHKTKISSKSAVS